jgi:hypothetical protein
MLVAICGPLPERAAGILDVTVSHVDLDLRWSSETG